MDSHEDKIYGGDSIKPEDRCRRCKGYFGKRDNCQNCGRHKHRRLLSRNRHRRRVIGGKRGRNSGTVKNAKKK